MHSHHKEYLAEMWMAITEEWSAVNKEIAGKDLTETLKTSGTETKRAAEQITGADQGVRKPGQALMLKGGWLSAVLKKIVKPPK